MYLIRWVSRNVTTVSSPLWTPVIWIKAQIAQNKMNIVWAALNAKQVKWWLKRRGFPCSDRTRAVRAALIHTDFTKHVISGTEIQEVNYKLQIRAAQTRSHWDAGNLEATSAPWTSVQTFSLLMSFRRFSPHLVALYTIQTHLNHITLYFSNSYSSLNFTKIFEIVMLHHLKEMCFSTSTTSKPRLKAKACICSSEMDEIFPARIRLIIKPRKPLNRVWKVATAAC